MGREAQLAYNAYSHPLLAVLGEFWPVKKITLNWVLIGGQGSLVGLCMQD